MPALIEVENLIKRYGSVMALDDINLLIDDRDTIGLVGKNGAGKTTLLSILTGVVNATAGEVRILGRSPTAAELKGKIALLLQDADFVKGIPVFKQLVHLALLQGLGKHQATNEVSSLLEQLNNAGYAMQKPETLSYGQRKRLGIVQALIGKPELVLLDEPTAGLDPVAADDMRRFIRTAASGNTAFLISSHNLYEIEDICSTLIVLDKGKLIAHAKISEFAGKDNMCSLTLDRAIPATLTDRISQLIEITDYIIDQASPEKMTLHFTAADPDRFQLQIQAIIVDHGYSIVQLNRGKKLADGVMELVNNSP